ncbi:hypothetical protein FIU97_08305 [Roseivivax sp. THAF40]|uniref:hypothetical protein n=1 Tax=unclassified Roseivivax TaxID=2639302 RepID=UPI001268B3C3|nr:MULTISPECIES: hypothetical protein [unclassified Roseivivax]QFS82800.1 hypothetical protein FIV09_08200 [Roseivivax sp. THAF197b]QFT46569.1 hypothetical protein FIU97_08305 [Roseivivax sp. THAF40]
MMKLALLPAVLTGAFCVIFSIVVNALAGALDMALFLGVSFVSGFLGNLFAQAVTGGRRK